MSVDRVSLTEFATPSLGGIALTQELPDPRVVEIGKALFFDKRLSPSGKIACASCHNPDTGFTLTSRFSLKSEKERFQRNIPHLYNLAWSNFLYWDGRKASLEAQAREALTSPSEIGRSSIDEVVRVLQDIPFYVNAFGSVFPSEGISGHSITKAIASFERTLISNNSPFDQYLRGYENALSKKALLGLELFRDKAGCIGCHFGPNFTDNEFHNTGVEGSDPGRHAEDRLGPRELAFRPYPFFATNRAFKTPGLRNVALTPPYFHDGSEATLMDVVRFYNMGGKNKDREGLARGIKPLSLSAAEEAAIVEFMKSLTSPVVIEKPNFDQQIGGLLE